MITVFAGPMPATITEGKLKAIGIATAKPLAKFPNISALAAHPKLAQFEYDSWAGIQVPRNTPDAVAQQLNKSFYEAMANPQTRAAFESIGNIIVPPMSLAFRGTAAIRFAADDCGW
jgi:tripartite-type tricarboxylate transporter receptor subunit TctC